MKLKETLIYRFFKSDKVEQFFFSALCATIFTAGLCHSMLDLSYKYLESQAGKSFYVDFNWVFWAGTIISLFYLIRDYIIPKRQLKFDFGLAILIQTMIISGVIAYQRENYSTIPYTWILPMAYIIGKLAVGQNKDTINKRIIIIMYVFMVALFLATILDFYCQVRYYYYWTESWPGFWSGEEQNRCGMALGLFLIESSLGFSICRRKDYPGFLLLGIFGIIVSLYWAKVVQSRTIMLLPVLALGIVGIVFLCENREVLPKRLIRIIFIILILLLSIIAIAFLFDVRNIRTHYNELSHDSVIRNVRFQMNWNSFKLMLENPLGRTVYPENYLYRPHNTFLQYGETYGLVVFVGIEIFRLATFIDAIKMTFCKPNKNAIKYLLIPVFVCLNINYSMDPNGYVQRYLWMIVLLISGIIKTWVDVEKQAITSE